MSRSQRLLTAGIFRGAALLAPSVVTAQTETEAEPRMDFEEYEPRSTLMVPENPVNQARFPFVDVHLHINGLMDPGKSMLRRWSDLPLPTELPWPPIWLAVRLRKPMPPVSKRQLREPMIGFWRHQ